MSSTKREIISNFVDPDSLGRVKLNSLATVSIRHGAPSRLENTGVLTVVNGENTPTIESESIRIRNLAKTAGSLVLLHYETQEKQASRTDRLVGYTISELTSYRQLDTVRAKKRPMLLPDTKWVEKHEVTVVEHCVDNLEVRDEVIKSMLGVLTGDSYVRADYIMLPDTPGNPDDSLLTTRQVVSREKLGELFTGRTTNNSQQLRFVPSIEATEKFVETYDDGIDQAQTVQKPSLIIAAPPIQETNSNVIQFPGTAE